METAPVTRRLAAVMIADVAGYSRLMERDESGTYVRIRTLFDHVVAPAIADHNGRLIRTMGDGLIADFPSATEALRAAIKIQRMCAERNGSAPDVDPIELRIGLNVADIVFDRSDIAGGGVNLAARLETLAAPGGICVSQAFREQIHEDLGVTYLDAGVQRVKNISKPVRVIRVLLGPASAIERIKSFSQRLPPKRVAVGLALVAGIGWAVSEFDGRQPITGPEKLSILVADFKPSDAADVASSRKGAALAQQIYLALSPDRHLLQVKRAQTAEPSVRPSGPAARYYIEGVIAQHAGQYRVDVRLVASESRTTLWGDRFQLRDFQDASIDAAARRISHGVRDEVVELETKRINASPPARADSMDLVLLAYAASDEADGSAKAKQYLERALQIDPKNVPALVALSGLVRGPEQDRLTLQAVTTDPLCADAWAMRSEILFRIGHRQAALDAVDRALKINPANAFAVYQRQHLLMNEGAWSEVIRPLDEIEFEFAKAPGALRSALQTQCVARLFDEQDAEEACNRFFAESGSEGALALATAASARNRAAAQAVEVGKRLKERHPAYSVATHRARLLNSGSFSPQFIAQFDKVVMPALVKAGVQD